MTLLNFGAVEIVVVVEAITEHTLLQFDDLAVDLLFYRRQTAILQIRVAQIVQVLIDELTILDEVLGGKGIQLCFIVEHGKGFAILIERLHLWINVQLKEQICLSRLSWQWYGPIFDIFCQKVHLITVVIK